MDKVIDELIIYNEENIIIDKAKMILGKLIDQFENDRIGLVAFAGAATTILPRTNFFSIKKLTPKYNLNPPQNNHPVTKHSA